MFYHILLIINMCGPLLLSSGQFYRSPKSTIICQDGRVEPPKVMIDVSNYPYGHKLFHCIRLSTNLLTLLICTFGHARYIDNPQDKRLTSVPWGRVSPELRPSNIRRDGDFGGLGRGEPVRMGPLDKSTFTTVEHILEVFMIRTVKDLSIK